MKPTVGRIVNYHFRGVDFAAIITRVLNDVSVNLYVFPNGGFDDITEAGLKTSVLHDDRESPENCTWHWPLRKE